MKTTDVKRGIYPTSFKAQCNFEKMPEQMWPFAALISDKYDV